jgi:hypothetical protein
MSVDLSPIEAINEFYKLKNDYEVAFKDKYVNTILKADDLSKKEKRQEYARLPKPECINCKRNVGTIFLIRLNKEDLTHDYIAKCGDVVDPCPLNINITYGLRNTYEHEINNISKEINDIKVKIIEEKNNLLFGYSSPDNDNFTKLSEDLKNNTEFAGFLIEQNIQLNDNPAKEQLIQKKQAEFGTNCLVPFQTMISEYNDTERQPIMSTAIQFYLAELLPLATEIRNLKYQINLVEYEEVIQQYYLIQKKNSLESLQSNMYEKDNVNSFVRGMGSDKRDKVGTSKLSTKKKFTLKRGSIKSSKPVNLGMIKIIEDTSQSPIIIPPTINNRFKITDEIVTWENPEYQTIWTTLPDRFKNIIVSDPSWMLAEMDYLVKEKSFIFKLVSPPNLRLPPLSLPTALPNEHRYDFGNALYNNLTDMQREVAVTFLPSSGTNYQPFLDTVNGMMKSQMGL